MRITLESLAESLERTTDPAFAVDGEGNITAWNLAAETALGYSQRNALGKICFNFICGKDAFGNQVCQRECLVFRSLREGRPVRRFRMHVRADTGHYVEAECATLSVVGSTGEATIIHLLRMLPGTGHGPKTHPRRGDTRPLRRAMPTLTPREAEILGLLAAGKGTGEMVKDLGVSPATVRTHVENVLRKLEVHSRLEAVVVAARDNLV